MGGSQTFNGRLRPLSAICAQSSTIVHFQIGGPFGPFSKGNFRHKMMTIVGNRGQLWTSTLIPHLQSPHWDSPDVANAQDLLNRKGNSPKKQKTSQKKTSKGNKWNIDGRPKYRRGSFSKRRRGRNGFREWGAPKWWCVSHTNSGN